MELPQSAHRDGVAQGEVNGGGVIATVDAQRAPGLLRFDQPLAQFCPHVLFDLFVAEFCTAHQSGNLFVNRRSAHKISLLLVDLDGG